MRTHQSLDDISHCSKWYPLDQVFGRRDDGIATFTLDGGLPYQNRHPDYFKQVRNLLFHVDFTKASRTPVSKGSFYRLSSWDSQRRKSRKVQLSVNVVLLKVIVCANGSIGNGEYYIASAAGELIAHPAGSVELIQVCTRTRIYFHELMMEVGIEQNSSNDRIASLHLNNTLIGKVRTFKRSKPTSYWMPSLGT